MRVELGQYLSMINNGKRTEWSPTRSEIMRVKAGVRFVGQSRV